jgi:hypothetical protein
MKLIPWLGPLDDIGFIFTENADVCLVCRILREGKSAVLHFQFLVAVRSIRPYLDPEVCEKENKSKTW